MSFHNAIVIAGKICSGKSSLLKAVSEHLQWPIVSFGSYIREVARTRNLNSTRSTYQKLGEELYWNWGARRLLFEVLDFSLKSDQNNVLFDGVRHQSILQEIRSAFKRIFIFYLEADERVRYSRFVARQSPEDEVLSLDEFLQIDSQPVESEIESIKNSANLVLDSTLELQITLNRTIDYLAEEGLTSK